MPGGSDRGVIPKVMDTIFGRIRSLADVDVAVRVGFVEIHTVIPTPHSLLPAYMASLTSVARNARQPFEIFSASSIAFIYMNARITI